MNRQIVTRCALMSAVALMAGTSALPTQAANLLTNPGFEYPQNEGSETKTISSWVFYTTGADNPPDIERENFANNTPGGTYSVWLKVFEAGGKGVYQDFSNGVEAGTSYTFSGSYYFQDNFATTDAVCDLELAFYGGSTSNDLGNDTYTYIAASSAALADDPNIAGNNTFATFTNPATGSWTPYSVTATAPAGTTLVEASFDYYAKNQTSGPTLSAFVDDGDLEGAGNPPSVPTWNMDSSGDWNNANNWNTFTVPNGVGAAAQFQSAITADRNVYTDVPITVGSLDFNNANKYVIDGAGSLTLQASSGNATVTVEKGTQEINLPTTLASNTVFNVSSGATLVIADPLTISAGKSLSQTGAGTVNYQSIVTVGSGASFSLENSTHAHELDLGSNSTAALTGSNMVLQVDNLSLASGAKMDLGTNETDVNYTGASPEADIRADLSANSITSSAIAGTAGTGIGYFDTGSQVQIKYTWIGDLDLNGVVNSADLQLMSKSGTDWQHGDLNYDGVVNGDDYALFALGESLSAGRNITSVPEPAAAGLLLAAGLLIPRRRRA